MLSEHKASVLIVDDTPENLDLLKSALKGEYRVQVANSGTVALQIAEKDPAPDLILLDIMMPGMDGYEVIRHLKDNEATRDIPVIFITALSDIDNEMIGFALGAVDYITKPFSVPIVRSRVRTQLALYEAQNKIARESMRLLEEREIIEEVILLMRDTRHFDKRNLRYLMSSVDKTNGDVLFSVFTPDGRQWILVGDIAGHGPTAALGIPLISQIFYRHGTLGGSGEELLTELNTVMFEKLPAMIYMPYGFVEVAADRSTITVWNGGLPGSLLLQADGHKREFPSSTFPLGACPDLHLDKNPAWEQAHFAPDAALWLFTDGLTEMPGKAGPPLADADIHALLAQASQTENLDWIVAKLAEFHGNADFPDDMTLVEVRPGQTR